MSTGGDHQSFWVKDSAKIVHTSLPPLQDSNKGMPNGRWMSRALCFTHCPGIPWLPADVGKVKLHPPHSGMEAPDLSKQELVPSQILPLCRPVPRYQTGR